MAVLRPVREAVSASPMGWEGGWQWRCPTLSFCHTNRGRATNGLSFQSFLAAFFFSFLFFLWSRLFIYSCHPFFSFFSPPPPLSFYPLSSPFLAVPPTQLLPLSCLPLPSLSLYLSLSDLAAVVCCSASSHAGFPWGQAARRQPSSPSQPGHALATHQHTFTEWQRPQLPAIK